MENVLKAKNIVKKYNNRKVLDSVDMNISKGDIYGFIGKNGAGKTTFMKVVLDLTKPDSGTVELFNGKSINETGLKVGSLIEAPGLYKNATGLENLKRFAILYGDDETDLMNLLEEVGLKNAAKKKVKGYSLGMRQRLGIAISLLGNPEFLLLDEPINGLDPEGIKDIRDLILKLNKEKGITFLVSSHLLDELSKIVTRYGIINNGQLIEEIDAKMLRDKCKNKLVIEVNNPEKAKEIISPLINDKEITIENNKLEIESFSDSVLINKTLINNGFEVSAIYQNESSLEEYFMQRIGG